MWNNIGLLIPIFWADFSCFSHISLAQLNQPLPCLGLDKFHLLIIVVWSHWPHVTVANKQMSARLNLHLDFLYASLSETKSHLHKILLFHWQHWNDQT